MSHRNKKIAYLPKCKQCGACCVVKNEKGEWVDCKFLVRYISGGSRSVRSRCTIYQHRLYVITGHNQYCTRREHTQYAYPNCPFNDINDKMHPKYLK